MQNCHENMFLKQNNYSLKNTAHITSGSYIFIIFFRILISNIKEGNMLVLKYFLTTNFIFFFQNVNNNKYVLIYFVYDLYLQIDNKYLKTN